MKQRNFELLCAAMLGFGQLCVWVGYDSESFILESVIYSIHERNPHVDEHAGYYGQAVIFAAFTITCIFSPSLLNISTPKICLVFSAISYTMFPLGFLFFNIYFYYFTCVLLGIGIALLFMGNGSYLSQHSTRETIESNVSISWAVSCCCLFVSATIFTVISSVDTTVTQDNSQRRYSNQEIKTLFGVYTGIGAIGILIFGLMPSKNVENSLESAEKKQGFMNSLKLTCSTVISLKLIQIVPLTVLGGFNVSFWLSILPTAMNFTKNNAHLTYIQAVFGLGAGIGEVLTGFFVSSMSKRIKGFGMKPTMVMGTLSVIVYCTLAFISIPFEAPMRPTSEKSLWIGQSYPLIFVIAFFCGVSDCCINGVRSVICALVLPQRRAQSFAVTRMYHAAACMICFFFSPIVPLYIYTTVLPLLSICSTFLFFRVVDNTHVMEKKFSEQVGVSSVIVPEKPKYIVAAQ